MKIFHISDNIIFYYYAGLSCINYSNILYFNSEKYNKFLFLSEYHKKNHHLKLESKIELLYLYFGYFEIIERTKLNL